MKKTTKIIIGVLVVIALIVIFTIRQFVGINNGIIIAEEDVKTKWAQVENVYQRRFDLIPNLVATVKGYAEHEQSTLAAVTEARSKMGGVTQLSADALKDPQAVAKFQQAQASLGGALQRLMVVSERYPDLKANANFRDLQVQLEGTENRITVERKRYNESVQRFNTYIRVFPNSIIAGFVQAKTFEPFKAEVGSQKAPEVKF